MDSLKARFSIIFVVVALALFWNVPNFLNGSKEGDKKEKNWFLSGNKLTYGLDIQGGLHLVMGVDVDSVIREVTQRISRGIKAGLAEKGTQIASIDIVNPTTGEFNITLKNALDIPKVEKYIEDNHAVQLQILEKKDLVMTLRFYEEYLNNYKSKIVQQSIETIRNRIDEFGVAEPSITAQGKDRILVQLPGIKDAQRAKDLINKTARLDFIILSDEVTKEQAAEMVAEAEKKGGYALGKDGLKYTAYWQRLNDDLKDKLPENTKIYFIKNENAKSLEQGKIPLALNTEKSVGGDSLEDAYVTRGQYGELVVAFSFDPSGAGQFSKMTGENVGKNMAIVLDKVIKSYPNIRSRIPNGRGIIEMGRGADQASVMADAQLISTALRAGALPASLQQLEERTVGPTLGKDSIEKGKKAGLIGALLVLIFMVMYYKVFGVIADIALTLNILLIFAVLTSLGATLTLPGVAGVALTIGMAVDANVIIFERIKEELLRGTSMQMAIKEGYSRAFSAIFDANITTVAVCVVLMYYGTGPVRGFAVTLTIGIIASMFTAIYVTRAILDLLVGRFKMTSIKV